MDSHFWSRAKSEIYQLFYTQEVRHAVKWDLYLLILWSLLCDDTQRFKTRIYLIEEETWKIWKFLQKHLKSNFLKIFQEGKMIQ